MKESGITNLSTSTGDRSFAVVKVSDLEEDSKVVPTWDSSYSSTVVQCSKSTEETTFSDNLS